MEQEGWDYGQANSNGKTVFIFRDTGHIIPEIQEKILAESYRLIQNNYFNALFTEGVNGLYVPEFNDFKSENDLKQRLQQTRGKWGATEILAYKLKKQLDEGSFRIFGLENKDLLQRQKNAARRVGQLAVKIKKKQETYEEGLEFDRELQLFNSFTDERTQTAVELIGRQMQRSSVNTAGLIFGDGHYKEMVDLLAKKGIGYVSFYPGKPAISQESGLEYALNL